MLQYILIHIIIYRKIIVTFTMTPLHNNVEEIFLIQGEIIL